MKAYSIIIEYDDDETDEELHKDILACDLSYKRAVRAARCISKGLSICREVAVNKLYVIGTNISDKGIFDYDTEEESDE